MGYPRLFLRLLLLLLRLGCWQLERLWRAVVTSSDRLPGAGTALEVAEGLGELKRLGDDTLLLLVVADLGVAGQGEVLSQRMTLETVISHDSSKIGMASEEHAKEIVDLSLVPVGTVKETGDTGDGRDFVGVGLDTDTRVVADREEIVDDFKSVLSARVVGGSDRADLGELGSGVV